MPPSYPKALLSAQLFSDMDDGGRIGLITCLSPRMQTFCAGEIILLAGYPVEEFGIITNGYAEAYSESRSGERVLMTALSPGSMFGEVLASTLDTRSPVTIYALGDVDVAFLSYARVLCRECPSPCDEHGILIMNMLKIIADKYFLLNRQLEILRPKKLRGRIAAYLFSQAEDQGSLTVRLPFSKSTLSDYLMADRSAFSRELSRMEQGGLIRVEKRLVEISDPDRLRQCL